jgi:hypothetical protein
MFDLSDVELIIATVPWRYENLIRTLSTVRKGGVQNLHLILDGGHDQSMRERLLSYALNGSFRSVSFRECEGTEFRGYGERWYAAACSPFPIVQILDDDLWVDPDYFAYNLNQLLELYQSHGARIISLGGWSYDHQHYYDIGNPAPKELRLGATQNNAVTFFSDIALGMCEEMGSILPAFYGSPGEDEGPISCYCWLKDIPVYRPAGAQPITYHPTFQNDPRGLFMSSASKVIVPLRQILYRRYGWKWHGTKE